MKINILAIAILHSLTLGAVETRYKADLVELENAFKNQNLPTSAIQEYRPLNKGASKFSLDEKDTAWAGYYMPMDGGGIATRWNAKPITSFGGPTDRANQGYLRSTFKITYFKTLDDGVEKNKDVRITDVDVISFLNSEMGSKRVNAEYTLIKNREKIDEAKARKFGWYYDIKAESLKAKQIFISTSKRSDEEAKQLVDSIARQVNAKNFAEVAAKYTDDKLSVDADMGQLNAGDMIADFEKVVFNLNDWEISKPIKTYLGYHIVLAYDVKAKVAPSVMQEKMNLARKTLTEYKTNTLVIKKVMSLSKQKINELSPAEKFDLYQGDYNFSGTKWEQKNRGSYRDNRTGFMPLSIWEGFCNGARAAGIMMPEPTQTIKVTNPDGIEIEFQPVDLKALATAAHFYVENVAQIGKRTPYNGLFSEKNPEAPNMALFDIALRSFLANSHKPFIIDKDPGPRVSNISVIGYDRKIEEIRSLEADEVTDAPKETVKVAVIHTTLELLGEVEISEINGPTKADVATGKWSKFKTFSYKLFLDKDDQILDGLPLAPDTAPDFVWFPTGDGTDSTFYKNEFVSPNEIGKFQKTIDAVKKGEELNVGNKYFNFDKLSALVKLSAGAK